MDNIPSTSTSVPELIVLPEDLKNDEPYSMSEVYKLLKQRRTVESPTSTHDLEMEVENLKKDIQSLKKENKLIDYRVSKLENYKKETNQSTTSESSQSKRAQCFDSQVDDNFLSTLEMVISQKWYVKITLLIDNYFSKDLTALIDSGADLNVIQEGLIPTKYFHKTTHTLSHAGGEKLNVKYKLPKAFICIDKNYIQTSFLLTKDISNQVILGTPFIQKFILLPMWIILVLLELFKVGKFI